MSSWPCGIYLTLWCLSSLFPPPLLCDSNSWDEFMTQLKCRLQLWGYLANLLPQWASLTKNSAAVLWIHGCICARPHLSHLSQAVSSQQVSAVRLRQTHPGRHRTLQILICLSDSALLDLLRLPCSLGNSATLCSLSLSFTQTCMMTASQTSPLLPYVPWKSKYPEKILALNPVLASASWSPE